MTGEWKGGAVGNTDFMGMFKVSQMKLQELQGRLEPYITQRSILFRGRVLRKACRSACTIDTMEKKAKENFDVNILLFPFSLTVFTS